MLEAQVCATLDSTRSHQVSIIQPGCASSLAQDARKLAAFLLSPLESSLSHELFLFLAPSTSAAAVICFPRSKASHTQDKNR